MAYQFDLPVVLTSAGAQPTAPATLLQQELAYVEAESPGATAALPGLLVEDISSTNVGALVVIDAARVELLSALSPNVANVALLNDLGAVYGTGPQGSPTNTSVNVTFYGTANYVIPAGFLVGDGTNTYKVQDGGIIDAGTLNSGPLNAIAVNAGSWAVPANTVTRLLTSVPPTVSLTVNNTSAGTPGSTTGESYSSYRTRIMQAGLAACVGGPRLIKTLICANAGLTASQVSVQQASPGIRVIVVGGNISAVAYAIFQAVADVSQLVGSAVSSGRNVTVSLVDYPNTYSVEYVASPLQTFTATATWNTTLSTFTGGGAFPGLVQQPIADYINGLAPGQVINLLEMNNIFQAAVADVLDPSLLTRLVWSVEINGSPVSPGAGESYIAGDAESYFSTTAASITVTQG